MEENERDEILDFLTMVKNDILRTIYWAKQQGYKFFAELQERDLVVVNRLIEEYKRKEKG